MSQRAKNLLGRFVFVTALTLTLACAQSDKTNNLPSADPPGGDTQDLPSSPIASDPRFPALLAKAVEIDLKDKVTYAGLKDLASNFFEPFVYSRFALEISKGRETDVSGSVLIGFEDFEGFWGAILNTVPGTSTRSSSSLNLIFSDNDFSVRVTGNRDSSDNLTGNIYYRLRAKDADGEILEDECLNKVRTCTKTSYEWDPENWDWVEKTEEVTCPSHIPQPTQAELAAECKSYMNLGLSTVKHLGTFKGKYSNWVK